MDVHGGDGARSWGHVPPVFRPDMDCLTVAVALSGAAEEGTCRRQDARDGIDTPRVGPLG